MAVDKFTLREQILIFIVVATLVGGAYALFRFVPQHKAIGELNTSLEANKEKVKNPPVVEAPTEDAEDLNETITKIQAELDDLENQLEIAEKNLAPVDSQEMILKISDFAKDAGVKVIENVPYLVPSEKNIAETTKTMSKSKAKRLAKAAKKKGVTVSASAEIAKDKPKEGELVYKLVNNLNTPRRFQKITLEGNFFSFYKFLQLLKAASWQTAIVKLDMKTGFQTPAPGIPQPLTIKLIIAI